jgi:formylglycine-generating enzyme required for sulfatase activity
MPRGGRVATDAFIALDQTADNDWELTLRPANRTYRSRLGDAISYEGRDRRRVQDWRRFPVTGVSANDVLAYARWLDATRIVPGARLCSELEWERAARGADTRTFPHGEVLEPDDANFDVTYARSKGYGPDEVGSHPASLSPFGLADTVGNVWEITRSVLEKDGLVVRGGSFYQFEPAQRLTNRNPIATTTRDDTVGVRICATVPKT